MVLSYAVAPVVRPGAFQTLCLIQVFGFLSLRPGSALKVGLVVITLLCAAWGFMVLSGAEGMDPRAEALKIAVASVDLLVLTLQSRRFALLRERTHHEKRALAEAAAKLQFITCHDGLTGLCNRAHMDTLLQAEVQRLQVTGPGFSVALVDLDHFKRINDSLGHQAGDAVLVGFARLATDVLRETDVVSRWGGEEFLILMPDTVPGDNAAVALHRLRQRLAAAPIKAAEGPVAVRFSCGIAPWEAGLSIDQLLERADRALYRAKHDGRNQTVVWGP
jgi:diguanylate cyclase (GGDEF)-like protein